MFACLLVSKIILNRLQNNFHEVCRLRTGEKSLKFRTVGVRVSVACVGYPLLARNTKIDGGIPSTECSLVCACDHAVACVHCTTSYDRVFRQWCKRIRV